MNEGKIFSLGFALGAVLTLYILMIAIEVVSPVIFVRRDEPKIEKNSE